KRLCHGASGQDVPRRSGQRRVSLRARDDGGGRRRRRGDRCGAQRCRRRSDRARTRSQLCRPDAAVGARIARSAPVRAVAEERLGPPQSAPAASRRGTNLQGTHHDHDHRLVTDRRALTIALVLVLGLMVGEVVGGIVADSLALLADAGHMLTDAAALAFAVVAATMAARPASGRWTFGYARLEILAAQANGITL